MQPGILAICYPFTPSRCGSRPRWGIGHTTLVAFLPLRGCCNALYQRIRCCLGPQVFPEGYVDARAAGVAHFIRLSREHAAGTPLVVLASFMCVHIVAFDISVLHVPTCKRLPMWLLTSFGPFYFAHDYLFVTSHGVTAVSLMEQACNMDLDAFLPDI